MKNLVLFVIAVIAMSFVAQAQDRKFLQDFNSSVNLNKPYLADVNLVHPGNNIILFKNGSLVPVTIKSPGEMPKGQYDSLWRALKRAEPSPLMQNATPQVNVLMPPNKDETRPFLWAMIALVTIMVIGLFVIIFVLLGQVGRRRRRRRTTFVFVPLPFAVPPAPAAPVAPAPGNPVA